MAKVDYYELCALRFEKWYMCDLTYNDLQHKQFSYNNKHKNGNEKLGNQYPCYKEWYEAGYTCNDDLFDFMMELHYAKILKGQNPYNTAAEFNYSAKRWDAPDMNRKTYTY